MSRQVTGEKGGSANCFPPAKAVKQKEAWGDAEGTFGTPTQPLPPRPFTPAPVLSLSAGPLFASPRPPRLPAGTEVVPDGRKQD